MSDRRIYLNSRVDTSQLRDTAHGLTFYGIDAIRRVRGVIEGYNPGLNPLPEPVYMITAFGKHNLPPEFRQEWKAADQRLVLLLKDIRLMKHPDRVWRALFQKFQYAKGLPSKQQALGYLSLSEARLQHLASSAHDNSMTSTTLAGRIYVENTMIRGAIMGSTFFITPDKPNLN